MTTLRIDNQYATGRSRQRIERALIDGGKNLGHLAPGDLGAVEDFHTSGRIATSRLAGLAEITSDDEVLDAASGVGGTARYLADQYGCRVACRRPDRRSTAKRPVGSTSWSGWRAHLGAWQT
jgi:sarcosine/dimethylglycine N-methyltransferase